MLKLDHSEYLFLLYGGAKFSVNEGHNYKRSLFKQKKFKETWREPKNYSHIVSMLFLLREILFALQKSPRRFGLI